MLFDTLPKATQERVSFGKTVTGITASSTNGILVQLQDGTYEEFDMVVGCDGVKSAVKEYIETGNISKKASERDNAIYSGIRIRYAVQDGTLASSENETQLRQYFGDGGYSLYGEYGAGEDRFPTKCAFTIFRDDDFVGPFKKVKTGSKVRENNDWSQDNRVGTRDAMLDQLAECGIPDQDLQPVISSADRFFELGVYFHNPFSLSGWSREVSGSSGQFCALCGDAAHAMPPFLGQGSNQAIQDAYCLAKKIYEYNAAILKREQCASATGDPSGKGHVTTTVDLKRMLKDYEAVRWPATTSISAKAAFLGYLETGSPGFLSKFRDIFFFVMGKIGVANKILIGAASPKWDNFPGSV